VDSPALTSHRGANQKAQAVAALLVHCFGNHDYKHQTLSLLLEVKQTNIFNLRMSEKCQLLPHSVFIRMAAMRGDFNRSTQHSSLFGKME
jgi:hypothetical protein